MHGETVTKYNLMSRHHNSRQVVIRIYGETITSSIMWLNLNIWRQHVTISFANKLKTFCNSIKNIWLPVCSVRNYRLKYTDQNYCLSIGFWR